MAFNSLRNNSTPHQPLWFLISISDLSSKQIYPTMQWVSFLCGISNIYFHYKTFNGIVQWYYTFDLHGIEQVIYNGTIRWGWIWWYVVTCVACKLWDGILWFLESTGHLEPWCICIFFFICITLNAIFSIFNHTCYIHEQTYIFDV